MQTNAIVLPRSEPDLDGVACAVAYAELLRDRGESALPWYPGTPDAEARYLIRECRDVVYASIDQVRQASRVILVDASGLEGFPDFIAPDRVVEVIDHRFHHDTSRVFPFAKLQIERVGSAATLIVEKFKDANRKPSRSSLYMLYGAIHSNTQRLRGSVTSERDRQASAWLEKQDNLPPDLLERQFDARRRDILEDLSAAIGRECKQYVQSDRAFSIAQLEFEGAERTFAENEIEFYKALAGLGPEAMLNLVDLETAASLLLVPNVELREFVAERTGLVFQGDRSQSDSVLLRKQIVDSLAGHRWDGA